MQWFHEPQIAQAGLGLDQSSRLALSTLSEDLSVTMRVEWRLLQLTLMRFSGDAHWVATLRIAVFSNASRSVLDHKCLIGIGDTAYSLGSFQPESVDLAIEVCVNL